MPGEMSFAAAPTADTTTFPDVRAVGFDGPGTPVVPAEWIRGPERGWEGGSGSPANPPSGAPGSRRGTLSLVLGLLAIVLFVVQFGVLSVAAMVLGIQHLRTAPGSAPGRRSAVLGIVLGALSLLPSLLMAVGILAEL